MEFNFFDPKSPVSSTFRFLPHWQQDGVTYFITFRMADSLPRETLRQWRKEQFEWLKAQGITFDSAESIEAIVRKLPAAIKSRFQNHSFVSFDNLLDGCQGACHLKDPSLSATVGKSLLHFNGVRYVVSDFVVMPNHVHLLVGFKSDLSITTQCESWKRFSATELNKQLDRSGRFWQAEQFDHIVRSAEQFEYFQEYIAENPEKAKLRSGEYLYHTAKK
jgi:putative transposase